MGPKDKAERNERIGVLKVKTKLEDLCQGVSVFFSTMLMMVFSLDFEEKPYYEMMRRWIKTTAAHGGIVFDNEFDWTHYNEDNMVVAPADEDDRQTWVSSMISRGSSDSANFSRPALRPSEGGSMTPL